MYLGLLPVTHPLTPRCVVKNNETSITLITRSGHTHAVVARPRNADSCRGDAPKCAFFDEVAFVTSDFWYQFAYPLLQVGKRVFTCATTPPHAGSFFCSFIAQVKAANATQDYFFRLINHSLVCEECCERGVESDCCHKLHLVPPWKSILRFNQMKQLVPANRAEDFQAEVFGVLKRSNDTYLPAALVDAFVERPPVPDYAFADHEPVYVAIDPPSHHRSNYGMSAIIYGSSGQIVVLGLAEISARRADVLQVQRVVYSILAQLRRHRWVKKHRTIIPIIECNSNEVFALSLLQCFSSHGPVHMPFVSEVFGTDITPNIGVWTNERNKVSMLQTTYSCLLDGRLSHASDGCTENAAINNRNIKKTTFTDSLALLARQLKSFRDLPNGKITGVHADGTHDDLGMSFMMALYWSHCIRALGAD